MPRGGKRAGTPGRAYSNRSDLNAVRSPLAPGTVPVQAAPGQTYGQATQQIRAQQQVPMAAGPQPDATLGQMLAHLPNLTAPTQRPDEHVLTAPPPPPAPPSPMLQGLAALNTIAPGEETPQVRQIKAALSAAVSNQGAL